MDISLIGLLIGCAILGSFLAFRSFGNTNYDRAGRHQTWIVDKPVPDVVSTLEYLLQVEAAENLSSEVIYWRNITKSSQIAGTLIKLPVKLFRDSQVTDQSGNRRYWMELDLVIKAVQGKIVVEANYKISQIFPDPELDQRFQTIIEASKLAISRRLNLITDRF